MSPGIGQKSDRTMALELQRRGKDTAYIADALNVDEERIRELLFGNARRAQSRRRAISPASSPQRAKVKTGRCIVTGVRDGEELEDRIAEVDPAHLWPRGLGGCDDPLCVVPLERRSHRAFDDGELDILPALVAGGFYAEIGHAVVHARGNLTGVLQRLTGERYIARPPDQVHVGQLDVEEFHRATGHTIGDAPAIRDGALRARLVREEAEELAGALEAGDLVGSIKEACDVIYVAYGGAVEWGINLAPFWEAVHRSNMAKAGGPVRGDGKRLKPEGWQPPDLVPILERQTP